MYVKDLKTAESESESKMNYVNLRYIVQGLQQVVLGVTCIQKLSQKKKKLTLSHGRFPRVKKGGGS